VPQARLRRDTGAKRPKWGDMLPFGPTVQIANEAPTSFRSSAVRPGALELVSAAFHEVLSRRRLISYLVRAQIKKQGTDTVLGNVWWILDPLISMLIYVLVMTVIFARKTPDFPIFLLSAMIPFKWFTGTIGSSVTAVVSKGQLIKQIQFPKIVLPLTICGAEVVNLGFGMIVLIGVMLIAYPTHLTVMVVWVPVIAAVQFVFTLGLSLIVSSITVFYRDIGLLIEHVMRLLFYVAPILWGFDALQGRAADLEQALGRTGFQVLHYNPVAILLESYRHAVYGVVNNDSTGWTGAVSPDLLALLSVLVIGIVLCFLGALLFKRLEPAFAKVL
jgi:lipopolysaccharide transport system permease protein